MSAKAKEESTSAGVDAYYMLASAEVKEIADACEKQASKRGGAKDGPSRGAWQHHLHTKCNTFKSFRKLEFS